MIKSHCFSLQRKDAKPQSKLKFGIQIAGVLLCWALIWLLIISCAGCGSQLRGKGGRQTATLGNDAAPLSMTLQQPENPKADSGQEATEKTEENNSYPPGTIISNVEPIIATARNGTPIILGSKTNVICVGGNPANSAESAKQSKTVEKGVWTKIGAAYEDSVGRILATMKSIRWIQIVGIVLVLFGLASLFWPYLRAVVNSTPTSLAVTGFGAALIFVTPFVALNPWLCITVAAVVCVIIWLAHNRFNLKQALAEFEDVAGAQPAAPAPSAAVTPSTAPTVTGNQ